MSTAATPPADSDAVPPAEKVTPFPLTPGVTYDMGELGHYHIVQTAGLDFVGLYQRTPDMPPPAWTYYTRTADLDDAVNLRSSRAEPLQLRKSIRLCHGHSLALHSLESQSVIRRFQNV